MQEPTFKHQRRRRREQHTVREREREREREKEREKKKKENNSMYYQAFVTKALQHSSFLRAFIRMRVITAGISTTQNIDLITA